MNETLKRSNSKMSRLLKVEEESDGRVVRSATVVTKDDKLKKPVIKLAPVFYECFSQVKQGKQCWRQSIARRENEIRT